MNIQFINKKQFKKELVIALFIALLPFVFYLYRFVPEDIKVWEIGFIKIDSGNYDFVESYIWLLFVKYFTLSIFSIWFVTCKHKWKFVLLFPVLFEIYKIFRVINYTIKNTDLSFTFWNVISDEMFFYSILVFILYVFMLCFVSNILYNNAFNTKINEEINNQLDSISNFNKKDYNLFKKEFMILKKKKKRMKSKEYLIELIALRDQIAI